MSKDKNVNNLIMNILPDNRPITSLQIVEDYEKWVHHYVINIFGLKNDAIYDSELVYFTFSMINTDSRTQVLKYKFASCFDNKFQRLYHLIYVLHILDDK